MTRPLRIEFEDAIYHVCARGDSRPIIFFNYDDYACFVDLIEQSVRRFAGLVFGFVLMPNHFHLIVQTVQPNLSRWMHWLTVSYSVYFNRQHRCIGHGATRVCWGVENGDYLIELAATFISTPFEEDTSEVVDRSTAEKNCAVSNGAAIAAMLS
jgi:putative transposase